MSETVFIRKYKAKEGEEGLFQGPSQEEEISQKNYSGSWEDEWEYQYGYEVNATGSRKVWRTKNTKAFSSDCIHQPSWETLMGTSRLLPGI